MDLGLIKHKKVLFVEDETDVRLQSAEVLKDLFAEVISASDGAEALRLFDDHRFDLVITDILMPNMSGLELIKAIKKECACDVPTIITTAFTDTEYLLEAIKIGVDGYLLKPISVEELVFTANKALLPIEQRLEIAHYKELVSTLGLLIGGKKIEILDYFLANIDRDGFFYGSYEQIMSSVEVSKPTVIKFFRDLIDAGVVERIKNGVYQFIAPEQK